MVDFIFIMVTVILLTYDILKKNKHNIVVHESDLPKVNRGGQT